MEAATPIRRRTTLIRWLCLVAVCLVGLAGVGILAIFPPTESSLYPKCQSYQMTGLHCPGCGTTRSLHCFLNGKLLLAFQYNLFAPIVAPLGCLWLFRMLWRWVWEIEHESTEDELAATKRNVRISLIIMGVMFAYAILRNLPYDPFTRLAPPEMPRLVE